MKTAKWIRDRRKKLRRVLDEPKTSSARPATKRAPRPKLGHYTFKRYHSEKERDSDGTWRHSRIVLRPESDRDGYEPIVFEEAEEGEIKIVAEMIGVLAE